MPEAWVLFVVGLGLWANQEPRYEYLTRDACIAAAFRLERGLRKAFPKAGVGVYCIRRDAPEGGEDFGKDPAQNLRDDT